VKLINCLILEDEPIAQEIIETYIGRIPFLHLVAKASNAIEAYEKLKGNQIDLIFCDIQMPQISGLEFLKSLPNRPQVIMTTAFHQHAHEGFELDVTDYLLKPIAFERFLRAIHKAKEKFDAKHLIGQLQKEPVVVQEQKAPEENHIFVKEDGKLIKVLFDDILYVEGMKDYVKIYITNRFIVTYLTMKKMEENLPQSLFVRIHKSYIVNQPKIQSINGNMLMLDSKVQLPIGMQYREHVLSKIGIRLLLR
jgi:two-component system, LytTR family, response regulator